MRTRAQNGNHPALTVGVDNQIRYRRYHGLPTFLAMLAIFAAVSGLSSCAGYTTNAGSQTNTTTPASSSTASSGVLSTDASNLSFGNVAIGNNAIQSFHITNSGATPATISQAAISGTGFSFAGATPVTSVSPGQSMAVQVQFAPQAAGPATGSLAFTSDASTTQIIIVITGTGTSAQPSLTIAPATLNFGNVTVGQSSTQTVTLTNGGSSNLVVNAATPTGNGINISGLSLPATIAAGQSVSFSAQFAPTTPGAVIGSITFTDNAPGSSATLAVAGSGVSTNAAIVVNPGALTFGSVAVGTTSNQTITITNTGTAPATVSQVVPTGAGFSVTGISTPITLAAGQSVSFSAHFLPSSAGNLLGGITISSTVGTTDPTVDVALSGTGTQAALAVNPPSVNFGSVVIGSSGLQTFTLTNSGNASATISAVSASGAGFSLNGLSASQVVAGGQSVPFTAKFTPTSAGNATGAISITSNAPGSPLTIAMSGTAAQAQPQLTIAPASVSFGNVNVNNSSSQTVTLTNSGSGPLTIAAASASGAGFSISGLSASQMINAGQSASFTAQFAPAASGSATGSISISSNAPGSPAAIALSGAGVQGTLTASPSSFNFGSVAVGSNGMQSFTLTNAGTASVSISAASASGAGFSISGLSAPQVVGAGQTASFSAKFAPTSAGNASGSISITSNAPGSPLTITLSGTATQAQAQLTIAPTPISFGSVAVNSNSSQSVTLINPGNGPLTISAASVIGTGFSISGLSPSQVINAGQSASFTAEFAPAASGSAAGSISISSNASGSPATIALSGTGVQGALTASPSSFNFGNVGVGSNKSQTLSLTNSGTASVTISAASASGNGFSISGLSASQVISAGQSASFTAQFAPTASGSVTGSISIASNAPGSPLTIALSATGTQAQISATPSSVSFGTVVIGNPNSQTITLRNTGTGNLTISQATVSGAGFSISGPSLQTAIVPGSSTTFNAIFTPSTSGSASGSVTLFSNDPNSPLTISLSGTGAAATLALSANPTSLSFGNVNVGSNSSQSLTLTNSGNGNITVSGVTVSGAGFSATGVSAGLVLTPTQTATLNITFAPSASGSASGTVTIASNATSPTTISVSGAGAQVSHSVLLTWQASGSTGVIGYNVYRGTVSGGPYTMINSSVISATQYTDSTVQSGQTYYYVVTSVETGDVESAYSSEVTAVIP